MGSSDDERDQRRRVRDDLTRSAQSLGPGTPLQERIATLGFEGEAAKALDLLPLVLVAWADGKIQAGEREEILNVLRARNLEGTQAFTMIHALLETRPSDAYLEAALGVLKDLLAKSDGGADVVNMCIDVAASAGQLGCFDPIAQTERDMIAAIAKKLGPEASKELERRLDL